MSSAEGSRLLRRFSGALTVACWLISATVSAQEGPAEIARRDLLTQAEEARHAGDHGRALDLALRAGRLRMTPSLRLMLAQEHDAMQQPLAALQQAGGCVREATADASLRNRERILESCSALVTALEPRVGRVTLRVAEPLPAGLTITVAGALVADALWGVPYPVQPGAVLIEASAPRHVAFRQEITVVPGASREVTITLADAPQEVGTPVPLDSHDARSSLAISPGVIDQPSRSRWWTAGWVGLGIGGVSLGVGGVALGLRESSRSYFNQNCPSSGILNDNCANEIAYGNTLSSVAIGAFVGGGVLATVSIIALLIAPTKGPLPNRAWNCGPSQVGSGLSCGFRF